MNQLERWQRERISSEKNRIAIDCQPRAKTSGLRKISENDEALKIEENSHCFSIKKFKNFLTLWFILFFVYCVQKVKIWCIAFGL